MNFVFLVSCIPWRPHRIALKEKLGGGLFGARLLSSSDSQVGAMFHDTIEQSSLKADVFAGFFAFNPLMLQNLSALGEEPVVECRIHDEMRSIFFRRRPLVLLVFHKTSL